MTKIRTLAFIILMNLSTTLSGQMNPDNKFKKIDTRHFELIFPESMTEKISSIADELDRSYDFLNPSLGIKDDYKISIIFNNQTAYSNAYVTLAPKYSMFYPLPPQVNIGHLFYDDWIKLLAVHEMRHTAQFHKLNYGFNKLLYILFGEYGLAVGIGMSAPTWFFEGDAVYMETSLTDFGRGRLSSFSMLTRAMLIESEVPDYATMHLGSNKNVYPDQYEFGYLMNAWLREKYGNDIFDKILKTSSTWNFIAGPYAFNLGVHQHTGKTIFENYDEMLSFLTERWRSELDNDQTKTYYKLNTEAKSHYTNYSYPLPLFNTAVKSDDVYVYKSGKFHSGAIVKISPLGKETFIAFTGYLTGSICAGNNTIIWAEEVPDLRWSESQSVIKWFDTGKRSFHELKTDGRLFAPSVSRDGRLVAAIGYYPDGKSSLVILDKASSSLVKKITAPDNILWQTPRFGNHSDQITIIESSSEGKSIVIYDIAKEKWEKVFGPVKFQISDPFIHDDYVLFHSDMTGRDNIYAISKNDGIVKQVSNALFGAFYPSVSEDGKYIYFSDFSRLGNDISRLLYQPDTWVEVKDIKSALMFSNTDPAKNNMPESIFKDTPKGNYQIMDYPDFANFLYFHSRMIDLYEFLPLQNINVALISSNKLQTHFLDLLYTYHTNENMHSVRGQWTFMGWFPVISLGGVYGGQNTFIYDLDLLYNPSSYYQSWVEKKGYFNIYLPFFISRGSISQQINAGTEFAIRNISSFEQSGYKSDLFDGTRYEASWFVYYSFKLDGNPRLFDHPYLLFSFEFLHQPELPFFNQGQSNIQASASFQIPGFFNNNALLIRGVVTKRTAWYDQLFQSSVITPRGMHWYEYTNLYFVSADYTFPIAYPDFNFLHFIYFREISGNLFFEHIVQSPLFVIDPDYFGADLLLHINLLNLPSEIVGGVRVIYYPLMKNITFEPIFQAAINTQF